MPPLDQDDPGRLHALSGRHNTRQELLAFLQRCTLTDVMNEKARKAEPNVSENGRLLRHMALPGNKRMSGEAARSLLYFLVDHLCAIVVNVGEPTWKRSPTA